MSIIQPSIIKALRSTGTCALEHPLDPNIVAKIQLKCMSGSTIQARVSLVSLAPRKKIDTVKDMQGSASGEATLEITVKNLCTAIYKKYEAIITPPVAVKSGSSSRDFATRVLEIPDILNPTNYTPYLKKGWADSTTENAVKYYAHTFGKFYSIYGEDAGLEDFEAALRSSGPVCLCRSLRNSLRCTNWRIVCSNYRRL